MAGNLQATVVSRHYMSSEHLWNADHSANKCRELETLHANKKRTDPEHRSYALGAVFSSVLFLESFVNETYLDTSDAVHVSARIANLGGETKKRMASAWTDKKQLDSGWAPALRKYQLALQLAGVMKFDEKVAPYRDVHLLIKLRNALVHFQPEWQNNNIVQPWQKELSTKFSISSLLPPGSGPWFPLAALGAGLAEWAPKAAEAFVDEWTTRLSILQVYKTDLR